jgi:hypothetical protein
MAPIFKHGRTAVLSLTTSTAGTIVFSSGLDDSELKFAVDTAETTVFGNTDKTYIVGLKDKTFSVSGHLSSTHAPKLFAMVGWSTGTSVNYHPLSTANGFPHIKGSALVTDYTIGAAVGDKVNAGLDLQGSGVWTSTTNA